MATTYTTRDGDTLDAICWRYYQRTAGVVEVVLAHNPGLSELGVIYASGVSISLPEIPKPSDQTVVPSRLWD